MALVPETDVAVHVNTGYKVVFEAASEEISFLTVSKKVKVKRSRYRPDVAQRVGRGIALLFHDSGTRRG